MAARYQISPVLINQWKAELMENVAEVFRKGPADTDQQLFQKEDHISDLERKVGQLTVEVDFLKKSTEIVNCSSTYRKHDNKPEIIKY